MPDKPFLLTVLRHGEVAGRADVFRGALDDPLSQVGWSRMQAAAEGLGQPPYDAVVCSPLRRCRLFAEDLAAAYDLPLQVFDDLREMRFGDFEGLTSTEARLVDPAAYGPLSSWREDAHAPAGETLADFKQRVIGAWSGLLADAHGRHTLLVTHAGVMRVLLQHLLGLPAAHMPSLAIPAAGHFQVSCLSGHPPVLLNLNRCADFSLPSAY